MATTTRRFTRAGAACVVAALGALIIATSDPLAAQRGGGGGASPPPIPSAKKFVTLGCISREPAPAPAARGSVAPKPGFLLTDTRGGKPTIYKLDGDESELTFHVGHWVEVSGPLSVPPADTSGPNAPAFVMKIASLTYLSKACPK